MALAGWHRGEKAIQEKLGVLMPMRMQYTSIDGEMPEEHRTFHTTRLPFLPITTLDDLGRPWSSIAAGSTGEPGFIISPNYSKLHMDIDVWDGDPFLENVKLFESEKMLIAGIGIEFPTRRRNKLAGYVKEISRDGNNFHVEMEINQALGNCPKYINVRDLVPHPRTHPSVLHKKLHLALNDRLPEELIDFIHNSDTVFLGTSYQALDSDQSFFPSHLGQNQRGGRAGFIRVRPSDKRTVVLPDYSGNRFLSSLGNIETTSLAGLTFVSFTNGDILYLTGDAQTLVGQDVQNLMPRQNVLTTVFITGYVYVRDALPVRQRAGTVVERSPYSPPIRLLAEEDKSASSPFENDIPITLAKIELHSNDLATFTWEAPTPVVIKPGQAAVLNFTDLLGAQKYAHMAPWKPSSVNDDRIRTWTVSSAHISPEGTHRFSLTMREKPGGVVTGALFTISRKLASIRPEMLADSRDMRLRVELVGITGDFTLEKTLSATAEEKMKSVLWISGGIGITPFLSMLSAIVSSPHTDELWDIVLVWSTREPNVLISLITRALQLDTYPHIRPPIEVFSHEAVTIPDLPSSERTTVSFGTHTGRVTKSTLSELPDLSSRKVYLCGPEPFEQYVLETLMDLGVDKSAVMRENFEY